MTQNHLNTLHLEGEVEECLHIIMKNGFLFKVRYGMQGMSLDFGARPIYHISMNALSHPDFTSVANLPALADKTGTRCGFLLLLLPICTNI